MPPLVDLAGRRFGRLTVISRAENRGKQTAWNCKCDCGNDVVVMAGNLNKPNHTTSCGCYQKFRCSEANGTHRLSGARIYKIYNRMILRCYKTTHEHYEYYGGRGISVCEAWRKDKAKFFQWALANGYRDDLTIDRIDCNGNYEPSNCRWIPFEEQARNRRNTFIIFVDGKDYSLPELSKLTGIKRETLYQRVHKNKPVFTDSEIEKFGFKNITQKEREAKNGSKQFS